MGSTFDEVLEAANGLSREERAELTRKILATLGEHGVPGSARLDVLRSAVNKAVADLDAGGGIEIATNGLRDHLRERGQLATERVNAKTT